MPSATCVSIIDTTTTTTRTRAIMCEEFVVAPSSLRPRVVTSITLDVCGTTWQTQSDVPCVADTFDCARAYYRLHEYMENPPPPLLYARAEI